MPNHPAAGAVIYAKDITRLSAFYAAVAGLEITHTERAHVILESAAFQLVVLAAPPDIAASITITTPPARRTNAPIKPVFFVRDIAAAREAAPPLGGELTRPNVSGSSRARQSAMATTPKATSSSSARSPSDPPRLDAEGAYGGGAAYLIRFLHTDALRRSRYTDSMRYTTSSIVFGLIGSALVSLITSSSSRGRPERPPLPLGQGPHMATTPRSPKIPQPPVSNRPIPSLTTPERRPPDHPHRPGARRFPHQSFPVSNLQPPKHVFPHFASQEYDGAPTHEGRHDG